MKSGIPTFIIAVSVFLVGCVTTPEDITKLEKKANVPKLSEIARDKAEGAYIRKLSLESLARLHWKPSNEERLQVYGLFASPVDSAAAQEVMKTFSADDFAEMDTNIVVCARLIWTGGQWGDSEKARALYDKIRSSNPTAATVSLCEQIVARPEIQEGILLLSIKLGLSGSEDPLVGALLEYGNQQMAEDYLNCGSPKLEAGAYKWAERFGYHIMPGYGSSRAKWGGF